VADDPAHRSRTDPETEARPLNVSVEAALIALDAIGRDGFAMQDVGFAQSLAAQVRQGRELTERQRYAVWKMLYRYTPHLQRIGVEYASIAVPNAPPPKASLRMVTLDMATGDLLVHSEFNNDISAAIKALPDRRVWASESKAWRVTATEDNIVALAAIVAKYQFTLETAAEKVLEHATQLAAAQEAYAAELLSQSLAAAADYEVAGLGGELMPFQRAGVKYAVAQRRTFIADEPGLGKTIQALAFLRKTDAFPAVVVCPASVKAVWKREAGIWLRDKRVRVISGRAPYEDPTVNVLFSVAIDADIMVVNYDILPSWAETLATRQPKAVIFDESHYIKTSGAKRTQAARVIAKKQQNILMLTGTPVLNRPAELMTQLAVMDRLAELGGAREFKRRYIDPIRAAQLAATTEEAQRLAIENSAALHELNDRIRSVCYIRRTKAQVMTDLPAKRRVVVPIELDNMTEYREAEGDLIRYLRGIDPKDKKALFAEPLARIEELKQLCAKGKMAAAIEWLEDFLASGEKFVMFAWHKAVVKELVERFDCDKIDGSTSMAQREESVAAFQRDPAKRLIVANIIAGGTGLTLHAASNVGFLELGWNPATHDQAEDRVHRIGQRDSVTAHYLMAPGTIDERIQRIIDAKRLVVTATTDGRIANLTETSVLSDLIYDLRGEAAPEEVPHDQAIPAL
jgi:SWI/SNF-related matrix-associated actin-dependent regulator 1 of chromatin subfamily A